jgi:hypothetical protein
MPSASIGASAAGTEALAPASDATTPSGLPLPKVSGWRDQRFCTA